MTPPNARGALREQARDVLWPFKDQLGRWFGEAEAAVIDALAQHALASEAAAYEKAAKAICRYCDFADKPKSRWSKANSNGKHFDEEGVEQYCDAWPIRQLAAPPAVTRDSK